MEQFDAEGIKSSAQGNILDGYKSHPYVAHLFGRIAANGVAGWRALLRNVAEVLTLARWGSKRPASTLNFGISYQGLAALAPELADELSLRFAAFAEGMPKRSKALGDDDHFARSQWEERHVWLAVHAQTSKDLEDGVERLKSWAREHDVTLDDERPWGKAIVGPNKNWHEHFGFRDDISYPAVEGWHDRDEIEGRGKLENERWVGVAPGEFLLGYRNETDEDPLDGLSEGAKLLLKDGTFGVFRRLRQDVVAFRRYLRENHGDRTPEELGACMMGRTLDGKPVGERGHDVAFVYDDANGSRCPLGAHVRRANPRNTGRHRLIRRGMPYGEPLPPDREDRAERGLWFVAFNASIEEQFELLQTQWLNGPVGALLDARDPFVGAGGPRAMQIEGDPNKGRPATLLLDLPKFVTCEGGQYYLVPSSRALKSLCGVPEPRATPSQSPPEAP